MINVRPWTLKDAPFCLTVRNCPAIQKWFRQDTDILLVDQERFMKDHPEYKGYVVEMDGDKIGLCALSHIQNYRAEFSIGVLPEYQRKGFSLRAMHALEDIAYKEGINALYSDVFVKNPALPWYLSKLEYKAIGVGKSRYWKRLEGWIDAVDIEKEL